MFCVVAVFYSDFDVLSERHTVRSRRVFGSHGLEVWLAVASVVAHLHIRVGLVIAFDTV